MAITRLKRKALRNKLKAKKKNFMLKHLLAKPVIKNEDKEQNTNT